MLNLRLKSDASLTNINGWNGPTQHRHVYPRGVPFRRLSSKQRIAFIRQHVWDLFDTPTSSKAAFFVVSYMLVLVLLSVVVFVVQTMPRLHDVPSSTWYLIEGVFVIQFTIELIARALCTPDMKRYLRNMFNWIDFIAVIPWYVEVLGGVSSGDDFFRGLRTARVLRVLKLSQYSVGWQLFVVALRRSREGLSTLLFLFFIGVTTFAALMFYAEQSTMFFDENAAEWFLIGGYECYSYDETAGSWSTNTCYDTAPFQSIPDAFWWAIVTMTTVGYGDEIPVSDLGRWIAAACMLCGLLVVAFPITIIGTNFNDVWDEFKEAKRVAAERLVQAREAEEARERERESQMGAPGQGYESAGSTTSAKAESAKEIDEAAHINATMALYHGADSIRMTPRNVPGSTTLPGVDTRLTAIENALKDLVAVQSGHTGEAYEHMDRDQLMQHMAALQARLAAVAAVADGLADAQLHNVAQQDVAPPSAAEALGGGSGANAHARDAGTGTPREYDVPSSDSSPEPEPGSTERRDENQV